ncbi:xylulokinase [Sodalis sp. RH21]|uniref:xylulokinase n=1 Tax=unclassified Sodalis (in: enterobacteria) TaxID=2636512 RepID=UPI0039B4E3EC
MPTLANREFVLGLDLGTSSCKVCAVDLAGNALGAVDEEYATLTPRPGWAEQDPAQWLESLGRGCRKLFGQLGLNSHRALGVSVTSAAHIAVLLNHDGAVLRPAILWNDQRSQEKAKILAETSGEAIFDLAGNWPTTTWSLPHLLWVAENEPRLWQQVKYILLSKDYVAYKLTGKRISDPATAVSAMLYDANQRQWSGELCRLAGIDQTYLPELYPIGAEIGKLTSAGADLLGLSPATRVFNGTLDSTAETFAAGVRSQGDCVIRLASAGGIHGVSHPPRRHRKLISYPYVISPLWLSQAGTSSCASAVSWAARLFGAAKPDFAAWSQLAGQSPAGSAGLMFHPYLMGERCPYWDARLRASFTGMGLHHDKCDFARAIYEGTAYSLLDACGALTQQDFALRQIKIVGGGGKSILWCQIVSDVFGRPVEYMPGADSSFGAALIGLVGLGVYQSVEAVPPGTLTTGEEKSYLPDAAKNEFYQQEFKRYRYIQTRIGEISHYEPGD